MFPLHVYNYVYINTAEKYASMNVTFFRFIKILNINTIKNRPGVMQINGKEKKVNLTALKSQSYKLFNQLCLYKIVQLSDFGLQSDANAYIALAHNAMTIALYKFLLINGNSAKLRNYTVFTNEHGHVQYYLKAVTIINLIVVTKMLMIFLWGKVNELKNKKK